MICEIYRKDRTAGHHLLFWKPGSVTGHIVTTYPLTLVQEILTEVKFIDRNEVLCNKTEQTKEILLFVTTYNSYNLATPNLKKILMKHWDIIQQQSKSKHIFNQPPIVSYRKEKSLQDILVHVKIPSISQ